MIRWPYIILVVVITVAGCSSSKPSKDDGNYYLGAFEDFDSEEHLDVVSPIEPPEVSHDIPKGLKSSGGSVRRSQGRGYRVQLFASRDKRLTDAELERAIAWWERSRSDGASGDRPPPIYVEYEQPYYKLRLGNYRSRETAVSDADKLVRTFSGAFVVPATINY